MADDAQRAALEAFTAAGLLDPGAPGAGERRELLQHLVSRGFTTEQVIEASHRTIPIYLAARLNGRRKRPRA